MRRQQVWLEPCSFEFVDFPMSMIMTRLENALVKTEYLNGLSFTPRMRNEGAERRTHDFNAMTQNAIMLGEVLPTTRGGGNEDFYHYGVDDFAYDVRRVEHSRAYFPKQLRDFNEDVNKFFGAEILWCVLCEDVDLRLDKFIKFASDLRKQSSWLRLYLPQADYDRFVSFVALTGRSMANDFYHVQPISNDEIAKIEIGFPRGFLPFKPYSQAECDENWGVPVRR